MVMDKDLRYAVFLELFFKWNGDLYRKHFDSVYKDDSSPMMAYKGDVLNKAEKIAFELRTQKPETVE